MQVSKVTSITDKQEFEVDSESNGSYIDVIKKKSALHIIFSKYSQEEAHDDDKEAVVPLSSFSRILQFNMSTLESSIDLIMFIVTEETIEYETKDVIRKEIIKHEIIQEKEIVKEIFIFQEKVSKAIRLPQSSLDVDIFDGLAVSITLLKNLKRRKSIQQKDSFSTEEDQNKVIKTSTKKIVAKPLLKKVIQEEIVETAGKHAEENEENVSQVVSKTKVQLHAKKIPIQQMLEEVTQEENTEIKKEIIKLKINKSHNEKETESAEESTVPQKETEGIVKQVEVSVKEKIEEDQKKEKEKEKEQVLIETNRLAEGKEKVQETIVSIVETTEEGSEVSRRKKEIPITDTTAEKTKEAITNEIKTDIDESKTEVKPQEEVKVIPPVIREEVTITEIKSEIIIPKEEMKVIPRVIEEEIKTENKIEEKTVYKEPIQDTKNQVQTVEVKVDKKEEEVKPKPSIQKKQDTPKPKKKEDAQAIQVKKNLNPKKILTTEVKNVTEKEINKSHPVTNSKKSEEKPKQKDEVIVKSSQVMQKSNITISPAIKKETHLQKEVKATVEEPTAKKQKEEPAKVKTSRLPFTTPSKPEKKSLLVVSTNPRPFLSSAKKVVSHMETPDMGGVCHEFCLVCKGTPFRPKACSRCSKQVCTVCTYDLQDPCKCPDCSGVLSIKGKPVQKPSEVQKELTSKMLTTSRSEMKIAPRREISGKEFYESYKEKYYQNEFWQEQLALEQEEENKKMKRLHEEKAQNQNEGTANVNITVTTSTYKDLEINWKQYYYIRDYA